MSHADAEDLKRRLSHFNGCFNEVIIIRVLSIISIHTAGLLSAAEQCAFCSLTIIICFHSRCCPGSCRELNCDIKIKENTFPVIVL